jgi:hypothetical protein
MHLHIGEGGHLVDRPSWMCPDGTPWPCPPARVQLAEAHADDRVSLAAYAGTLYYVATAEQPTEDPAELYERIVGWVR